MKNKILLLMALSFCLSTANSTADVIIDDFNTNRTYAPCCGAYGTYDSFNSNVLQNGSGTLVVTGSSINVGGFYHAGLGTTLWDFSSQTGLIVSAKAGVSNQASQFWIVFQDVASRRLAFSFPFSSLNTTNFTTLSKTLSQPDFTDGNFFEAKVVSIDFYGDYNQSSNTALRVELDYIKVLGTTNVYGPGIAIQRSGTNVLLTWPTNGTTGLLLYSTEALPGTWGTNAVPQVIGPNYQVTTVMEGTKFFRLAGAQSPDLQSGHKKEVGVQSDHTEDGLFGIDPTNSATVTPLNSSNHITLPPTTMFTNTYIDFASYSNSLEWFYWGYGSSTPSPDSDRMQTYVTQGSDHTGGTFLKTNIYYNSHTPIGSYPFQVRTTNCVTTYTYASTWILGDTNWPLGLGFRTGSGCNPLTNTSYVELPFSPHNLHLTDIKWITGESDGTSYASTNYAKRSEDAHLHLHTAYSSNSSRSFVLLAAGVTNVTALTTCCVPEYEDIGITATNISLMGDNLDADGKRFVQITNNATYDATPTVPGASNYIFGVAVETHKKVPLTWAYHQMFHIATNIPPTRAWWQAKYDAGSLLLGTDNDQKIPLNDPVATNCTDNGSVCLTDDVPVYVEFKLSDGPTNLCYYSKTLLPVFPIDFGPVQYFNVVTPEDYLELRDYITVNLKMVKKIDIIGFGPWNAGTYIGYKPATTVFAESADAVTCVHEWGHSCGLQHRGLTNVIPLNPGPETNAIMQGGDFAGRTKVNRYERGMMNSY